MKCSVCGKESDVIAEGKCLSCYEASLAAAVQTAPQAAVPSTAPVQPSDPSPKPVFSQPIQRLEMPHNAVLNLGGLKPAQPAKKKKPIGRRIVKTSALLLVSLMGASAATYFTLYGSGDSNGDSQKANLTAVTSPQKQPTVPAPQTDSGATTADTTQIDTTSVPPAKTDTGTTTVPSGTAVTSTADDTDGDGISNFIEQRIGTDPSKADTDGDGISDYDEVHNGTSPLKKDTDGDGCNDNTDKAPTDPTTGCSVLPGKSGLTPEQIQQDGSTTSPDSTQQSSGPSGAGGVSSAT